jgi:hypothetical protein
LGLSVDTKSIPLPTDIEIQTAFETLQSLGINAKKA